MGGNTRALFGCAIVAGLAIMGFFVFFSFQFADFRRRQARLSGQGDAEPIPTSELPATPPSGDQEPADPARVARALERLGGLRSWEATERACPQELPLPPADAPRTSHGAAGARVVAPESPFPIRIATEQQRALVALDAPATEPTLVLLRELWVPPAKMSRAMFRPGKVAGRAFLRVPGNDGILCVGDYSATNSARVSADSSELPLAALENELALTVDLVLRERRAAVESLRAARRTSAAAPR